MHRNSTATRADASQLCARSQALVRHSYDLCLRAQRARARMDAFRQTYQRPPHPAPPPAAPPNRQQMQMEALRAIVAVFAHFPIEDQLAMVKVLAGRTLIIAHARVSSVLSA